VDHEKSVVAVKPGIVAVQAQDTARACEVNFTASYHGPMDFVRRPSSAKGTAASWRPPEQIRKLFGFGRPLPVATAPRIGYRSMSR